MLARRGLLICFIFVLGLMITPLHAQDEVYFPTEEWRVSTPEAQGMDSAELAGLLAQFSQAHYNLSSLLVVRHGHVVAEAYSPLLQPPTQQDIWASSKSVVSTLIGILLRDGYLESLDVPVLGLFPDRTAQNVDANKEAMTVRHLLTETSGFACEDLFHVTHTQDTLLVHEDGLQYTLDLPMGSAPGSEFHYCATNVYLLSAVITELTGMTAAEFAAANLFEPLGITNYAWTSSPQGLTLGYFGLQIAPRDLAKIGYLYLHGGMWEGEQIIPAEYVEASLMAQVDPGWPDLTYSYLWWHGTSANSTWAIGNGGQYLWFAPDKDLIVVMTSSFPESIRVALQGYPLNYAAAALTTAEAALPENPTALDQLEGAIAQFQSPPAAASAPLPDMAAQISGITYGLTSPLMFPDNSTFGYHSPISITALGFDFGDEAQANVTVAFADGISWSAPVGLDGRYAASEGPLGMVGIRGEWRAQNEFTLYVRYAGTIWNVRLDMRFLPGAISILETEYASGHATVTYGLLPQ